jgi:hypothetical protein
MIAKLIRKVLQPNLNNFNDALQYLHLKNCSSKLKKRQKQRIKEPERRTKKSREETKMQGLETNWD